jgi:ATP-dependent Zn protease
VWLSALLAAAVILLIVVTVMELDRPAPMSYSAFFDQLEAGNVASVTLRGTEATGRFKRPVDSTVPTGTAQRDTFISRIPDVGDPALVPELRKQRVVIDVSQPSLWTWLLGRVPWPMLLFIGAMIVAAFARIFRRGRAQAGPTASTLPVHGMIGLLSSLFGTRRQPQPGPPRNGGEQQR